MTCFDRCQQIRPTPQLSHGLSCALTLEQPQEIDLAALNKEEYCLLPGLCDVHVHLREPGFVYKETIASGTAAAARGGYTALCAMPNLDPVPDSLPHLRLELTRIADTAAVRVYPYGAISVGEKGQTLADIEALAPYVAAFSDDGRGVQDAGLMLEAMQRVKATGRLLAAHCEVNSLLFGGCIHRGAYAAAHGLPGIPSASEWRQVERDIELAARTGCPYHVCHASTKESVELVRQAQRDGLDVSCETAPHYLLLDEGDLQDNGRFKMNPPLRSAADREALLEGLADGTIGIIATDHAPHSAEEKSRGLRHSPFGVVGLETALAVLYTGLVRRGVITLPRLVELLSSAPRRRFGLADTPDSFSIWDFNSSYVIDPDRFLSQGRATPFAGCTVQGRCLLTVCGGRVVWHEPQINA